MSTLISGPGPTIADGVKAIITDPVVSTLLAIATAAFGGGCTAAYMAVTSSPDGHDVAPTALGSAFGLLIVSSLAAVAAAVWATAYAALRPSHDATPPATEHGFRP